MDKRIALSAPCLHPGFGGRGAGRARISDEMPLWRMLPLALDDPDLLGRQPMERVDPLLDLRLQRADVGHRREGLDDAKAPPNLGWCGDHVLLGDSGNHRIDLDHGKWVRHSETAPKRWCLGRDAGMAVGQQEERRAMDLDVATKQHRFSRFD